MSSNADAVLKELLEGNRRFAAGARQELSADPEVRRELAGGQSPKAVVLTCADSRVPPSLIFDQGLGDLFVIRVAGNVVDDAVLGSVEYAVGALGVPLVLVMGHQSCGAVAATLTDEQHSPSILHLTALIRPAVDEVRARGISDNLLERCVRSNARRAARVLCEPGGIPAALGREGRLRVVSAYYSFDTGLVEVLE